MTDLIRNKKVALFTGCFANYYDPEVGMAAVKVLKQSAVEVILPDQVCCGLPMMAKGNNEGANRNIGYNTDVLSQAVASGYAIMTTCSSCSLFIKRDYKLYGNEAAINVANNTYHFSECLLKLHATGQLNTNFQPLPQSIFYQTPCHLKAIEIGQPTLDILRLIPEITIQHISRICCGMGGAYGFDKANYQQALEIRRKLVTEIHENSADRIVTDCGGCKLQIEAGCGLTVEHPIVLFQ